jgi:hypothetical protein
MDEGDMEEEGQNGKKGVGDRKNNVFFLELLFNFFDKTVSRSPPNEALSI